MGYAQKCLAWRSGFFYYGSAGREKEMTRFVTFQEACNKEREVALF